ncbi:Rieske domain-containing protein [Babesia ovata]|uniref:Rieske domain-containing protein n=1 Tax=Babesia ovata TaxID=189622 RepID=A0A2H6K9W6_9APIC|nr:Rieske domain-containing protein [Babesia ovata]GBE59786.1 Rieske domain-containing protein [Babesia ovata]
MAAEAEFAEANSDYVDVGAVSEFARGPRRLAVGGRKVAVFQHGDRFFAIDANCYHAAGRLEEHSEDIEEVNGEPCVRCPMHKYVISLSSGHSFYEAVEVLRKPGGPPSFRSLGFKSKGLKQRCHYAKVEGNRLLIRLAGDGEVESDRYAYV